MTVSIKQSKYRTIVFTIIISILLFPNIALSQLVEPQLVCKPYERVCSAFGNWIEECNEWGSDWIRIKNCSTDEYCGYAWGEAVCIPLKEKERSDFINRLIAYSLFLFLTIGLIISIHLFIKSLRQKRMKK
jgi:hypothetical protein